MAWALRTGTGKNYCVKDLAGSKQWDTQSFHGKSFREMINGGVTLTKGGCNWFSIHNHILEKGNNPSVPF
jgi:hypothetical protein